jgi:hypothetical protein
VPRRLGEVGLVANEKGEFFVESIRSYCTLEPSTGNLCLLSVITVELLFLGLSEPSGLGETHLHHVSPFPVRYISGE